MGKDKNSRKIPNISIDSIHELKSDIPLNRRNDIIDLLSYFLFALAGLAVYKDIGFLLWISFFTLISLALNRRYRSGIIPPCFLMLGFNCFLIYVFYKMLLLGLREV